MARNEKIGKCRLCLKEKKLCDSHLIPEFVYRKMGYDEKHRIYIYKPEETFGDEFYINKGIREYLLCRECELQLSKYENYVAKKINYIYNGIKLLKNFNYSQYRFHIKNINYKIFKLFLLSILWRASVSHKFKISIYKHEEIVRDMIYNENPGEYYEYGCKITFLNIINEPWLNEILVEPSHVAKKIERHNVFNFVFLGFLWSFFVSSNTKDYSLKHTFIKSDNELILGLATPQLLYNSISHLKNLKNNKRLKNIIAEKK